MNRFLRTAAQGLVATSACLAAGCDTDIADAVRFEHQYQPQLDALQELSADSIRYVAVSSAWDNWQAAHHRLYSAWKIMAAEVRGVDVPANEQDGPAVFEVKSPFPAKLAFATSNRPAEGKSVVESGTLKFRDKITPVFRYRRTVRGWNGGLYEIELTAER